MTTPSAILPEFVALAHRLADAARPVIRKYFRTPVPIDDKANSSPVTIADRESEAAMRALIQSTFPDHGILGEEMGPQNLAADWVWVLDPIDGTKAFITGKPCFGTLIALAHRGRPVLGIIDQAITDERWLGVAGHPSTLNGAPIRVRPCTELSQAYAYTTGPEHFDHTTRPGWDRIAARAKLVRYGADCYAYGLLALGAVDLVVEAGLKPYDYCALVPVIEGAGGTITDWQGGAVGLDSPGTICAAGDAGLHAQALAVLAAGSGRTHRDLIDAALGVIETLSLTDALALAGRPDVVFVDLRDPREIEREGMIPGAFHAPRGMLEFWIDPTSPYFKPIFGSGNRFVFYCQSGWRSALAARTALEMGLTPVAHVAGGFRAWKEGGGPTGSKG